MNLAKIRKLKSVLAHKYQLHRNRRLRNRNVTIISNNCIAGIIYHDCGLQFLSPTVNLWFPAADFFRYASNVAAYSLQRGGRLVETFEEGINYPIGMMIPAEDELEPITIYFQHYRSFNEAKQKWEQREKRINFDNICLIFEYSSVASSDSEVRNYFDNAPYSHKVMVTAEGSAGGENILQLPVYAKQNYQPGMIFDTKTKFSLSRWLDDFNYVDFLNKTQGKVIADSK